MSLTLDISKTLGALLVGGLFSSGLSGILAVQCIIYFKFCYLDKAWKKSMILCIWIFDIFHSVFIWFTLWGYFVDNFGNTKNVDVIPLTTSLSILFTAIITAFVHTVLIERIYRMSRRNLYLTLPIIILSIFRLGAAATSASEMILLGTYTAFKAQFAWLFSLGLALSSTVDVIITGALLYMLQDSRSKSLGGFHQVINVLILYTLENGAVTAVITIVSMLAWLTMGGNLIFLGIHFNIAKLYANSILVVMNSRHDIACSQTTELYLNTNAPILSHPVQRSYAEDGKVTSASGNTFLDSLRHPPSYNSFWFEHDEIEAAIRNAEEASTGTHAARSTSRTANLGHLAVSGDEETTSEEEMVIVERRRMTPSPMRLEISVEKTVEVTRH